MTPEAALSPVAAWARPDLTGKVALLAGATRGAGRAIAQALAACGGFVYCTGRSVPGRPGMPGRPETIQETGRLIQDAGGQAAAVPTDHLDPAAVGRLVERIAAERGRLDLLVNDVWGGNPLTQWGKRFWEHDLAAGLRLLRQGVETHVVTAHACAPLLLRSGGLVVEVGDGTNEDNRAYRENLFYDLAKVSVNRLAFGLHAELATQGAAALAVTPGFLRSEEVLDHFGVTEATWRDATAKDPYFAESETPHYLARGIAHLAADPGARRHGGGCLSSAMLARRYGFTDTDGRTPDFAAALLRYRETSAQPVQP
jgi:NAD(P)-dependent dehydrogenase (short-subunit alcohol dehydrogenase family)